MFLAFLFSSSQDIATDALAVNLLEPRERGLGNAIQPGGNVFGAIIGGGGIAASVIKSDYYTHLSI